jgi:hypothetical protein
LNQLSKQESHLIPFILGVAIAITIGEIVLLNRIGFSPTAQFWIAAIQCWLACAGIALGDHKLRLGYLVPVAFSSVWLLVGATFGFLEKSWHIFGDMAFAAIGCWVAAWLAFFVTILCRKNSHRHKPFRLNDREFID